VIRRRGGCREKKGGLTQQRKRKGCKKKRGNLVTTRTVKYQPQNKLEKVSIKKKGH